ncbi:MAG TPA: Bax inhibitor-1/YccA family protein [Dermatophilaceae bacterium]|nr:Bax inhibitor-1/YccA family protein [Dermatophilaceae bacterium]
MASNPVFNRIDKEIDQGRYARFGPAGAGVQDTMTSQQLEDIYSAPSATAAQAGRLTLDDVLMKTLGLFSLVVVVGAASWFLVAGDPGLAMPIFWAGMLGTLALGLVIAFKKTVSVPLIVGYAALEGAFVGAISQVFETIYPGIVTTAVLATVSVFAGMFLAWKVGLIKVTDRSRRIFGLAIVGYLLFSLVNVVAAVLGVGEGWGFGGTGMLGIAISVLGVGLASYSLAVDFDSVDKAVAAQVPERYSWLLAHGLIVSLVWLYLEILRLLARTRE